MPATVEILLWCAALATWLMMFLAIVIDGIRRLANSFRQRPSVKRKVVQ
jgi:hypothetical protein